TPLAKNLGPFFAIGGTAFMALISNVGGSAVSREGQQFWISQLLPAPASTQILAKLIFSALVGLAGGGPIGIGIGTLLRFSWDGWVMWLLGSIMVAVGLSGLALLLDMW